MIVQKDEVLGVGYIRLEEIKEELTEGFENILVNDGQIVLDFYKERLVGIEFLSLKHFPDVEVTE